MKKIFYLSSFLLCLGACNNADRQPATSENDVDAARNFIQAALNSDYQKARTFMLQDSTNLAYMLAAERSNNRLSPEEKKGYAAASIIIHNVSRPVNDSVTIVVFSNSFKNNPDTLKIVKQQGNWLVDFAYLFTHNSDTLTIPSTGRIDTISR